MHFQHEEFFEEAFSVTLLLSVPCTTKHARCKSRGKYRISVPATERLHKDITESRRRFDGEYSQFV